MCMYKGILGIRGILGIQGYTGYTRVYWVYKGILDVQGMQGYDSLFLLYEGNRRKRNMKDPMLSRSSPSPRQIPTLFHHASLKKFP